MAIELNQIIELVQNSNPLHAKKLKKNLKNLNQDYIQECNYFLSKYEDYLKSVGKTLEQGVSDYLRMISDFMYEQLRFNERGVYSNSSFEEVNKRVYNNPEVMDYYMNGLLLSQILWKHHYEVFSFFSRNLLSYASEVKTYLEVGEATDFLFRKLLNNSIRALAISYSTLVLPLSRFLKNLFRFPVLNTCFRIFLIMMPAQNLILSVWARFWNTSKTLLICL